MTLDQSHVIPVGPDAVFEAISNSRRRQVILSVARAPDAVSANDLAIEIAAIEEGITPEQVTGKQRARIYIALTQQHLQTLDELDTVEYDDRSKQVQATAATEAIATIVQRIETACYEPHLTDNDK